MTIFPNLVTQVTFARNCFPISARLVLETFVMWIFVGGIESEFGIESAKIIWYVRKLDVPLSIFHFSFIAMVF